MTARGFHACTGKHARVSVACVVVVCVLGAFLALVLLAPPGSGRIRFLDAEPTHVSYLPTTTGVPFVTTTVNGTIGVADNGTNGSDNSTNGANSANVTGSWPSNSTVPSTRPRVRTTSKPLTPPPGFHIGATPRRELPLPSEADYLLYGTPWFWKNRTRTVDTRCKRVMAMETETLVLSNSRVQGPVLYAHVVHTTSSSTRYVTLKTVDGTCMSGCAGDGSGRHGYMRMLLGGVSVSVATVEDAGMYLVTVATTTSYTVNCYSATILARLQRPRLEIVHAGYGEEMCSFRLRCSMPGDTPAKIILSGLYDRRNSQLWTSSPGQDLDVLLTVSGYGYDKVACHAMTYRDSVASKSLPLSEICRKDRIDTRAPDDSSACSLRVSDLEGQLANKCPKPWCPKCSSCPTPETKPECPRTNSELSGKLVVAAAVSAVLNLITAAVLVWRGLCRLCKVLLAARTRQPQYHFLEEGGHLPPPPPYCPVPPPYSDNTRPDASPGAGQDVAQDTSSDAGPGAAPDAGTETVPTNAALPVALP
ncbi:TPA_asm: MC162R [Molluscum contagiosum virus]|nr:TPA_asm: MC162R [Molluscum contagiosum virus]DBA40291.1 TPA_asm: MC162R [Molluscum contagiosum virus]DBA40471.1 TPA_asm: MC162R [Molluscum contagiosum virus]DBA40651.1 TPA_asm: MC162R [Molluscum contagiosum virus]DBA40831.1 TPA_asm: MC162R [Molluscum contagiosum virus]